LKNRRIICESITTNGDFSIITICAIVINCTATATGTCNTDLLSVNVLLVTVKLLSKLLIAPPLAAVLPVNVLLSTITVLSLALKIAPPP
jgi:hypothetical protein